MKAMFYTDFGRQLELTSTDGQVEHLPRYGAWGDISGRDKPEVIECGDDLDALKAKYGDAPVHVIGHG